MSLTLPVTDTQDAHATQHGKTAEAPRVRKKACSVPTEKKSIWFDGTARTVGLTQHRASCGAADWRGRAEWREMYEAEDPWQMRNLLFYEASAADVQERAASMRADLHRWVGCQAEQCP